MSRSLIVSFSILILFFQHAACPPGFPPPNLDMDALISNHVRNLKKMVITTVELVADQNEVSYLKRY